jgi:NAD(P)-dependent dehydrogenase (short-subunit alcohol dehydrogenase family)
MAKNEFAVIHGAGGAVGGSVARAFARKGAMRFLVGRHRAPVDFLAREILPAEGATEGATEGAQVEALDEKALDRHLQTVIEKAARIDIVFNAIGIPNTTLRGVPIIDLAVDQFSFPITRYTNAHFLIARLAARPMVAQRSGAITPVAALPSRVGVPLLGGLAPATTGVEGLTRRLSAELAPHGIRAVGLQADAMPDSGTIQEVFGKYAKAWAMSWKTFRDVVAGKNHPRRPATLAEMANVAAFMASDAPSAMTGTTVKLSMGARDD